MDFFFVDTSWFLPHIPCIIGRWVGGAAALVRLELDLVYSVVVVVVYYTITTNIAAYDVY